MRIQKTTREVFIGGGRASFSREAAYRNEAKARIAKKHPCECSYDCPDYESGYPGYSETCDRHMWPVEKWSKLVRRLARYMMFLDRRHREYRIRQSALNKAYKRELSERRKKARTP
jgi:hypothetical protein